MIRAVLLVAALAAIPLSAAAQVGGPFPMARPGYLQLSGGTLTGALTISSGNLTLSAGDLRLALTEEICFDTEVNDCIYADVDDRLLLKINGSTVGIINATGIQTSSGRGAIYNEVPSATNPTLIPNSNDSNTGVGHQATSAGSLIANSLEVARFTVATSVALFQLIGRQSGPIATIAANDTTPSVAGANYFTTSANGGGTAITDLDDPVVGQVVTICGGSNTNSSTIADSGNFALSAAFTASLDDCIVLLVQADNDYVELARVNN